MAGALSEALQGVALIGRGAGLLLRRPRLFVLGAIPPMISSVVFVVVMAVLLSQVQGVVMAFTPFAAGWNPEVAAVVRLLAGVALVAGAALLLIITFTALTLTLGAPLYDKISESVDAQLGDLPAPVDEPFVAGLGRSVRQSLTLIMISALVAPLLFAAGLIPVVGQTVVPVVSATFGGWILCTELVGSAFERRGLRSLGDRRALMRRHRARVLGFSVPVFLLMAVPFAAILVFPAAAAGGTVLARQLIESGRPATERPEPSATTPR